MQDQNQTSAHFSDRTDALAKACGVSLRDVAGVIGISPAMLFAYRTGKYEISGKAWRKLHAAETAQGLINQPGPRSDLLAEEQAPYDGRKPSAERAQIEAHLRALLDVAERVEGGLGWVRVQLGLHLRPEDLRSLDPAYNPVDELRRLTAAGGDEASRRKAV